MRRLILFITLFGFIGLFEAGYPQASTSTTTGTVHDASNAVVPGATAGQVYVGRPSSTSLG